MPLPHLLHGVAKSCAKCSSQYGCAHEQRSVMQDAMGMVSAHLVVVLAELRPFKRLAADGAYEVVRVPRLVERRNVLACDATPDQNRTL